MTMTKWQTTNYKGEQVTWYSETYVEQIKGKMKEYRELINELKEDLKKTLNGREIDEVQND